jgi:predicted dehydrogenase
VNTDRQLQAAVIGCGFIGCGQPLISADVGVFSHADAYLASENTSLVALCDSSETRLDQLSARFSDVATCTSIDDCLETHQPEIVSIATPDETHFAMAMKVCAFPSVRGVLLEKPIALNSFEGHQLVAAAKANNVRLAVNYSRRYTKRFQFIAEQIKAGVLGEIQTILGLYTKGILHNGSHWVDLLDMFGFQVRRVDAYLSVVDNKLDPTPQVTFRLPNGSACLAGCDERNFTVFEMDIVGTLGRVRITDGGFSVDWSLAKPSERFTGYTVLAPASGKNEGGKNDGGMKDAMLNAVDDLTDAVRTGRKPLSSAETAVTTIEVCEAVLRSLRTQSQVELAACPVDA